MPMTSDMLDQLAEKVAAIVLTKVERTTKPSSLEEWITEKEAQDVLGKKATSLWSHRKNGELVYTKIGKKTYYSRESVMALLNANKVEGVRYAA